MPFVYRYIDLNKEEVIYIGKVTKEKSNGYDPLASRHEQHTREAWYKNIGEENILLQYIETDSHTDADIYETWLINWYGQTGQLVNKGKMNWGKSKIDMYPLIFGKWRNFGGNYDQIQDEIVRYAESLYRYSEGLRFNVDSGLDFFCERVRTLQSMVRKSDKIDRFEQQGEFLRNCN